MRKRQGADDHPLEDGRPDRKRSRLEAVDEDADMAGERRERRPEADQQRGDAGALPELVRTE